MMSEMFLTTALSRWRFRRSSRNLRGNRVERGRRETGRGRRERGRGRRERGRREREEGGGGRGERGSCFVFLYTMNPHMPHTTPLLSIPPTSILPFSRPNTRKMSSYLALMSLTSLTLEKMTWCCLLSNTLLPSGSPGFMPGSSIK